MTSTLTEALLDPILAREPAGPRITYYDDGTGERIELSGVTLANWAAKTANLLRDEVGLMPGSLVAVGLPAHWQSAAVLLGAWWAGLEVVLGADRDADAALVTETGVDDATAPEVVALSLDPFGRPIADLPLGVLDYATAVRVHGDAFIPAGAGTFALEGRSVEDTLAAARARAEHRHLTAADRVLSTLGWDTVEGLETGLLAVLSAGASLVQVRALAESARERRVTSEKVTRELS